MKELLINKGYIPLDKSWIIRMGMLDLLNGYNDILNFLENQKELGEDLQALRSAIRDWKTNKPVNVSESGTLYRFLKFASWKLGLKKEFILKGSLKNREICDNPKIVSWPLKELLKLDNNTSQWASASVLLGNEEKIENPPYKLKLTYEALEHWKTARRQGKTWEPRYDETILKQALAFLDLIKKGKTDFKSEQAEDYCFARAFNLMTKEQGKELWPSLEGHESNRLEEMEKAMHDFELGNMIDSKDHRVIQSIVMLGKAKNKEIKIIFRDCVNKSWPQFWKFIEDANNL
jgi:hypothetical protein